MEDVANETDITASCQKLKAFRNFLTEQHIKKLKIINRGLARFEREAPNFRGADSMSDELCQKKNSYLIDNDILSYLMIIKRLICQESAVRLRQ